MGDKHNAYNTGKMKSLFVYCCQLIYLPASQKFKYTFENSSEAGKILFSIETNFPNSYDVGDRYDISIVPRLDIKGKHNG